MARRDTLTIQIEHHAAGPAGPVSSDRRVLALRGPAATARASGVFALIHGCDNTADQAYLALEQAFRRGGAADSMVPGQEEAFVSTVLRRVASRTEPESEQPAIALAICMKQHVVVGCVGGGRVFLSHHDAVANVRNLRPGPEDDSDLFTARVGVQPDDRVLLVDEVVASQVREHEMWSGPDFPIGDHAAWLVALAVSRSHHNSSAAVLQFSKRNSRLRALAMPAWKGSHAYALKLLGRFAAAAALVLLALIVLRSLSMQSPPTIKAGYPPGVVPKGLRTESATPARVLLAWRPVPGAVAYRISLAGRQYWSKAAHITLQRLTPGQRYTWSSQAQFPDHLSLVSHPASFTVPPLHTFSQLVLVTPRNGDRIVNTGTVQMCWRITPTARQVELYLTGGTMHLHRHPSLRRGTRGSSAIQKSRDGSQCLSQALPSNREYAWQVGAIAPEYVEGWTAWSYFWLGQQPARPSIRRGRQTGVRSPASPADTPSPPLQPRPLQPTARPVYEPPTSPPVYQPPPQPVYQQPAPPPRPQPVYRRPVPTPAAAPVQPAPTPVPTSPVLACSNPPNCG